MSKTILILFILGGLFVLPLCVMLYASVFGALFTQDQKGSAVFLGMIGALSLAAAFGLKTEAKR